MELPINLAIDTTENWEKGDTALGESELAIEVAEEREDGSLIKYLLIGDGKPVGPNAKRLRATPGLIAGLQEGLREQAETITKEITRAKEAEKQLKHDIENHEHETFHDDTLFGKGTEEDPLSVRIDYGLAAAGITASAEFTADGTKKTFPLPSDFVLVRVAIVEINGLGQRAGKDYTLDLDERKMDFTEKPEAGDTVTLHYTVTK